MWKLENDLTFNPTFLFSCAETYLVMLSLGVFFFFYFKKVSLALQVLVDSLQGSIKSIIGVLDQLILLDWDAVLAVKIKYLLQGRREL